MATYTSVANGDWTNTAVWGGGGFPNADADIFNIANGTSVTYNVNTALANGFNDSTIWHTGVLTFNTGANMRFDGELQIYGRFEMQPNNNFYFKGSNAANHRIYLRNVANVQFIAKGSNSATMTLVANTISEKQPFVQVTSSTGFAPGDWIAIYKPRSMKNNTATNVSPYTEGTDEGFIVNQVSGNTIYFRWFTGPNTTFTSATGNVISVANSRIFRDYQSLIIANSTVSANIVAVNYTNDTITIDTNTWSNSFAGNTIHLTGARYTHANNEFVRKIAYNIESVVNSAANTITVSSAVGINVGETVTLTYMGNTANTTHFQNSGITHTVVNVSGNVVTLDTRPVINAPAQNFLFKLNRDCNFIVDSGQYGHITSDDFTTTRAFRIFCSDEVAYQNFGRGATFAHFNINGYYKRPEANVAGNIYTGYEIENNVFFGKTNGESFQVDVGGPSPRRQYVFRNNVNLRQREFTAGYYAGEAKHYNNYFGFARRGIRYEGLTGSGGDGPDFAFNLVHRCYDTLFDHVAPYSQDRGIHDNIFDTSQIHAVRSFSMGGSLFYNNQIRNFNYLESSDGSKPGRHIYTFIGNSLRWTETVKTTAGSGTQQRIDRGAHSGTTINELNYDVNSFARIHYGTVQIWDYNEGAWRTWRRNESNERAAWAYVVHIPPYVTTDIELTSKMSAGFTTTRPALTAFTRFGGNFYYHNTNPTLTVPVSANSFLYTYTVSNTYTTTSQTAFESRTLTINAVSYGRQIAFGVVSDTSAAANGWWERPPRVRFSNSSVTINSVENHLRVMDVLPHGYTIPTDGKIRLGGPS